jgi:hypothetical protein
VSSESKEKNEADGRAVTFDHQVGKVFANLKIGADVLGTAKLNANEGLAIKGMQLNGQGFILEDAEAEPVLEKHPDLASYLRVYINGADLKDGKAYRRAYDFYPLSRDEISKRFPEALQHLRDNVKPERDENSDPWRKENWHWFGRTHQNFRNATNGLGRYIGTTRTAKYRNFSFVDKDVISESKVVVIASEDSSHLAILSSKHHVTYAFAVGGMLGVGNDPTYNHTDCFNTFPFPELTDDQRARLRTLGEKLDAHRKRQQAANP